MVFGKPGVTDLLLPVPQLMPSPEDALMVAMVFRKNLRERLAIKPSEWMNETSARVLVTRNGFRLIEKNGP